MNRSVLVIEDDKDIAELVALHLRDESYEVDLAYNGRDGLNQLDKSQYSLLVLDLMLPEVDGLTICRQLRATNSTLPILMLTSKSSELDRVLGLEMGADDYLTKPFSIRELVARVKALLRRSEVSTSSKETTQQIIKTGAMIINTDQRSVTIDGAPVDLTAREFDLLLFFAKNPGRVYSRTQLLDQVWGYGHDGYEHTVNSHINRLRSKIEQDPANPHYVLTVWGVGYKFTESS